MQKDYLIDKTFIFWIDFKLFLIVLVTFIFVNWIYKEFINSYFTEEKIPSGDIFFDKSNILDRYYLYLISSHIKPLPLLILVFLFLIRLLLIIILFFLIFALCFSIKLIILKIKIINV